MTILFHSALDTAGQTMEIALRFGAMAALTVLTYYSCRSEEIDCSASGGPGPVTRQPAAADARAFREEIRWFTKNGRRK